MIVIVIPEIWIEILYCREVVLGEARGAVACCGVRGAECGQRDVIGALS